ncbi:hypothetical protein [Amycolatopsis samaneae]|uniref:DUF304 domain-containing protein n=1 Tax=Amycolatopsis samaneae TaxID=664691 RepID=A0ABW5G8C8_9PSEU
MPPATRALTDPLPRRAQALVDAVRRTGSAELRTSLACVAVIGAIGAAFVATAALAYLSPNPAVGPALSWVLAVPVLGVCGWLAWLLLPRARVILGPSGVTIRGTRHIPWQDIDHFAREHRSGRATYAFVRVHLKPVHQPGVPLVVGSTVPGPALPLLLSPNADEQCDALNLLLGDHLGPPAP